MTPFHERRFGHCGRFPYRLGERFADPGRPATLVCWEVLDRRQRASQGPNALRITSQVLPAAVSFSQNLSSGTLIIVGDGDDVALRRPQAWQLPKQHDRLAVADQ